MRGDWDRRDVAVVLYSNGVPELHDVDLKAEETQIGIETTRLLVSVPTVFVE